MRSWGLPGTGLLSDAQETSKSTGFMMKMKGQKEKNKAQKTAKSISQWPNEQQSYTVVTCCSHSKTYSEYSTLRFIYFSCHVCNKLNCSSLYKCNYVRSGPFPVNQTKTTQSKWTKATCKCTITRDYKTDSYKLIIQVPVWLVWWQKVFLQCCTGQPHVDAIYTHKGAPV